MENKNQTTQFIGIVFTTTLLIVIIANFVLDRHAINPGVPTSDMKTSLSLIILSSFMALSFSTIFIKVNVAKTLQVLMLFLTGLITIYDHQYYEDVVGELILIVSFVLAVDLVKKTSSLDMSLNATTL